MNMDICYICNNPAIGVAHVHVEGITLSKVMPGRYEKGSARHIPVCINHKDGFIMGLSFNKKEDNMSNNPQLGTIKCANCKGMHFTFDEVRTCCGAPKKVVRVSTDTSYADWLEGLHFNSGKKVSGPYRR